MPNASELERQYEEAQDTHVIDAPKMKIWDCKIGEIDAAKLPPGADQPMRRAIAQCYLELTGEDPQFIFSGWGAELLERERAVVEDRMPDPIKIVEEMRSGRGW